VGVGLEDCSPAALTQLLDHGIDDRDYEIEGDHDNGEKEKHRFIAIGPAEVIDEEPIDGIVENNRHNPRGYDQEYPFPAQKEQPVGTRTLYGLTACGFIIAHSIAYFSA
jgi:hypothetical protein